jgi:tetratricopeptide (TPR) repeat protein
VPAIGNNDNKKNSNTTATNYTTTATNTTATSTTSLNPSALADFYHNRGFALLKLGRLARAEADLLAALALRPQHPHTLTYLHACRTAQAAATATDTATTTDTAMAYSSFAGTT